MIRDGTSRPGLRLMVALLAAWLAAFTVIAAVHNHGLLGPISKTASLDRPSAGTLQVGACFACLASHVPVPVPGGPAVLSAPHVATETVLVTQPHAVRSESSRPRPSRAPPLPAILAA